MKLAVCGNLYARRVRVTHCETSTGGLPFAPQIAGGGDEAPSSPGGNGGTGGDAILIGNGGTGGNAGTGIPTGSTDGLLLGQIGMNGVT